MPVLRVPRYKLAQFKELSQKFENNCDTSFDNAAEVEKGQQEALGKKIVHADVASLYHISRDARQTLSHAHCLLALPRLIEKRIVDLVQIELPGGTVQADFARFPSARTRRFLTTGLARTSKLDAHNFLPHDPQDLPRCRLRIPRINAREQDSPLRTNYCCEPDVVKVSMASSELRRLHFKLIS
ncbi:unnamed protein product [Protopolystoma xenopodis]|uniref:Uncharacterized protein n=1 Tax=Protopolystoma xenopodis TaxID=117903 RepID=A0A448XBT1_9PLAT|nr:unnamed protein product [Protopolystoma xenopodis]